MSFRVLIYLFSFCLILAAAELAARATITLYRLADGPIDIQTPTLLAQKIHRLREFKGNRVLVLGDSVVLGQTKATHGDPHWKESNFESLFSNEYRRFAAIPTLFMNIAMNGALPTDMLRILDLLQNTALDMVIFNIGLRSFSGDFAKPKALYSRNWLSSEDGRERLSQKLDRLAQSLMSNQVHLLYLIDYFQWTALGAQPADWVASQRDLLLSFFQGEMRDNDSERMLELMKSKARYSSLTIEDTHPQVIALKRILAFLAKQNVKTIVFMTKENPDLIEEVIDLKTYAQLRSQLEKLIIAQYRPQLVYIPPIESLKPSQYLDQVHTDASGYRLIFQELWKASIAVGFVRIDEGRRNF